jgi:hypothetical protein
MAGRGQAYVPFQLSDLRKIKHLNSCTDAHTNTFNLHLYDPNFSIDLKGYYASTRPDSYLIRKAMGSGPCHSG